MNWKVLLIIYISAFCFSPPVLTKGDPGVLRTDVIIFEDWPADSMLDMGTISCPGGEIQWIDPVTPVCPGSGRIHLRKVAGFGCYYAETSAGRPEPRLSGVGLFVVNGNLDVDYTGPVWGTYLIVPSQNCNPADLIDPVVYWKGTWRGRRSVTCDAISCTWIGNLKLVSKGYGGDIDGFHFKGAETITTFTPMPIPWELIPDFPATGPEGSAMGTIKE